MSKTTVDTLSKQIDNIRVSSCSDFAALAPPDDFGLISHWYYASGNVNERYKRIVVRPGRGLPGKALMIGRIMAMNEYPFTAEGYKIECAIMLAENLKSAVAVPIRAASGNRGLLLVGNRQNHVYAAAELEYLQACSEELIDLIDPKPSIK
jgi:nitrogen regulatory protein A